jgi:2-amino-4-hydroxy-6-hydroxymethyldihydropteridine diphosphokinase
VNGPRTLDLDILLLGDQTVNEPGLEITHPRLAERAFVLMPLGEIAADVVIPGTGETVDCLLKRLPEGLDSDAVVRIGSALWDTHCSLKNQ